MAIINVIEERENIMEAIKKITERNPSTSISHAIIKYDLQNGTPSPFDYHNYPLNLVGKMAGGIVVIRVLNITAGSEDEGSKLLKEILTFFEFEFKDGEIFTTANVQDNVIRLVYQKEDMKSDPP